MAVLKHTSPTAWPVAPKPKPSSTVPSASTKRAVDSGSDQPESSGMGFMNGYIEHFPAKCEAVHRRKCDQIKEVSRPQPPSKPGLTATDPRWIVRPSDVFKERTRDHRVAHPRLSARGGGRQSDLGRQERTGLGRGLSDDG